MSDQGEHYENSWVLYHILDSFIGIEETVAVRRRITVIKEQTKDNGRRVRFYTGSRAEGFEFVWSDADIMYIDKHVIVLCPDDDIRNQPSTDKTLLMMREANSRPGYVNLELIHQGQITYHIFQQSIVTDGGVRFISSEIYSRVQSDLINQKVKVNSDPQGPATNILATYGNFSIKVDAVHSFLCYNWPTEANEWLSRPRLYGWPNKALRDEIVQGGCQLVPVGDKTSPDPFLQWRISFVTAERKLIYSFTHVQFLVYGLLKIFLRQISPILNQMLGEEDILSSYIIKTALFYAIEISPESFWQVKHMFFCFLFCLEILISWVKAGHCPHYFIMKNNMFLGKVYGENQQKLLRFLIDLRGMNWKCLSVGILIQPSIEDRIKSVKNGEWKYVLPPSTQVECENDINIFRADVHTANLPVSLKFLSASNSDIDEFVSYYVTLTALSATGMKTFGKHTTSGGNKEKYKSLGKCKNLLRPLTTLCSGGGLLTLATYYYQTGNYIKTLEICGYMMSSPKPYLYGLSISTEQMYEKFYCGRGYNLLHKRQAFVSDMEFPKAARQFCPSQLLPDITKYSLPIPPLPYAVFLSFLCYHELGDIRRRDTALIHLRTVKYDEEQGAGIHWIVHNLLGICYEMVGDTQRALREYRDSLGVERVDQFFNSVKERIERLQHSQ